MLGQLDETRKEATVIGAGFSGLLAAYRLLGRGYQVSIYETAARTGGLLHKGQTEYGLVEAAAHSIRSSPAMDKLFQELKIETAIARTRKKYILRGGKMRSFPLTLWETLELAARAVFVPAKMHYENLEDWAEHHCGCGALDNIFYPMMHGIYAASPSELSPYLVFPKLVPPAGKTLFAQAWAARRANHYKPRMMAPLHGMSVLTDKLYEVVQSHKNAKIFLGESVSTLPDAPNIILTPPAHHAAEILQKDFPKSAAALETVRYAPLISATVFLHTKKHRAPDGIGVLCAAGEPSRALGILFNSATFDGRVNDEDVASYTVMLGGTGDPGAMDLPDDQIEHIITTELQTLLKLSSTPLKIVIHRWRRAIPVYSPELATVYETLRSDFCAVPGRMISGNYSGQISLRGMADDFYE